MRALILIFAALPAWGAACYSKASADWQTASTWASTPSGSAGTCVSATAPFAYPNIGDSAGIQSGNAVTLNGNLTVGESAPQSSNGTGTITMTASTSVVGTGTAFTTEIEVGDHITFGGTVRAVLAITDNTHLTIDANGTASGSSFTIERHGITMIGTGTFTVASGVSLRVRGPVRSTRTSVQAYIFTMNPGSTLTFDSTQAASPSTTRYQVGGGPINAWGGFSAVGNAGSRITITSDTTGGAAPGQFVGLSTNTGAIRLAYVDMSYVGDSTHDALDRAPVANGTPYDVTYSTFDNCGRLGITATNTGAAAHAGTNTVTIHSSNRHTNSLNATDAVWVSMSTGTAVGTGTRSMVGNYFDKGMAVGAGTQGMSAMTIEDNWFRGNIGSTQGGGAPASFARNVVRKLDGVNINLPPATYDQNAFIIDYESDNPHFINVNNGSSALASISATLTNNVFEFTGSTVIVSTDAWGDLVLFGDNAMAGPAAATITMTGNVSIPSGTGYSPGTAITWFGFGAFGFNFVGKNNAFYSSDSGAGHFSFFEGGGASSTLSANITTTSATSATVASGTNFKAGMKLRVDSETMQICSVSGTTLNFGVASCPNADGRGIDGTTAATHSSSAAAWEYTQIPSSAIVLKDNIGWSYAAQTKNVFMWQWTNEVSPFLPNAYPTDVWTNSNSDYNVKSNLANTYPNTPDWPNQGCGYAARFSAAPCAAGQAGEHDLSVDVNIAGRWRGFGLFDTDFLGQTYPSATLWQTGTSYTAGDMVYIQDAGYYGGKRTYFTCTSSHTSGATTKPGMDTTAGWRAKWDWSLTARVPTLYASYQAGSGITDAGIGCSNCSPAAAYNAWIRQGLTSSNPAVWCSGSTGGSRGPIEFCGKGKALLGAVAF